jgi:hypothetical protein
MHIEPRGLRKVIGQLTVINRPIGEFANVVETENADLGFGLNLSFIASARRSRYGKADRIPLALRRRPATTAGIAEIAESFKNVLRGSLIFMPRSRTVAVPSAA